MKASFLLPVFRVQSSRTSGIMDLIGGQGESKSIVSMKLLSYSTKANVSKNRFAKNLVYHHLISKTKITGRLIIEDSETITDLFTSLLAKEVRKIITIKQ